MINTINKQHKLALLECFILSFPLLLLSLMLISGISFKNIEMTPDGISLFFLRSIVLIPFIFVFIVNIVFYSILKKKCELEMNTLFHGIGFTSSVFSILLLIYILFMFDGPIDLPWYIFAMHIIPFASLFYFYAALPKNNDKSIRLIIVCLMVITVAFFIFSAAKDEIFRQILTAFILPVCLGLYAGYYAIYRTVRLNSRLLTWAPVLIIFISSLFVLSGILLLTSIITSPFQFLPVLGKAAGMFVPFICSFITVYLIGAAHKRLIKEMGDKAKNN